MDLNSLKAVALIGVIHGIAEVIERSIIVLIDYMYHQIYEKNDFLGEVFEPLDARG